MGDPISFFNIKVTIPIESCAAEPIDMTYFGDITDMANTLPNPIPVQAKPAPPPQKPSPKAKQPARHETSQKSEYRMYMDLVKKSTSGSSELQWAKSIEKAFSI